MSPQTSVFPRALQTYKYTVCNGYPLWVKRITLETRLERERERERNYNVKTETKQCLTLLSCFPLRSCNTLLVSILAINTNSTQRDNEQIKNHKPHLPQNRAYFNCNRPRAFSKINQPRTGQLRAAQS